MSWAWYSHIESVIDHCNSSLPPSYSNFDLSDKGLCRIHYRWRNLMIWYKFSFYFCSFVIITFFVQGPSGWIQYKALQWNLVVAFKHCYLLPAKSYLSHFRQMAKLKNCKKTSFKQGSKAANYEQSVHSGWKCPWIPGVCNTMWRIWPLELCNISRSLRSWL